VHEDLTGSERAGETGRHLRSTSVVYAQEQDLGARGHSCTVFEIGKKRRLAQSET
jgi:hypothetical protein